jgi:hypothetical protein
LIILVSEVEKVRLYFLPVVPSGTSAISIHAALVHLNIAERVLISLLAAKARCIRELAVIECDLAIGETIIKTVIQAHLHGPLTGLSVA